MSNKFNELLKKALTEYEREIVENTEQISTKNNTIHFKRNLRKYITAAAIFVILIPSIFIGSNIYNNQNNISKREILVDAEEGITKGADSEGAYIDNLNINAETLDFKTTIKDTEKLIEKYKGKIENQDISNLKNENTGRYATYSIKIPDEDADKFIEDFEKLTVNITSTNKSSYNVTDEVKNIEENLNNVNTKLERLKELLKEATSLTEITEIEGKIQEAESEKNSYEENLEYLGKEIDFTTVYISINEVTKYSGTENINEGFGKRITKAFKNSKIIFIRTIQNTILGFITLLPFITIVLVIGIIVFVFFRKRK
ncbi:DUF4349 domain-containing protein [Miniphocaeibacter halophilus]|uniref:DUF4349 domain-containing protein n=1 Tax=Miniphocaeibacter halophilus TaxID=2931922 RepID=A0AC61MS89_9FIRM|nr:DUF4349 domain-containing protein [Miniphocaeibacter halophilus]QQK08514.1 DUF4349 domain-containing protein [Miniphocaeibacter halophilus]